MVGKRIVSKLGGTLGVRGAFGGAEAYRRKYFSKTIRGVKKTQKAQRSAGPSCVNEGGRRKEHRDKTIWGERR